MKIRLSIALSASALALSLGAFGCAGNASSDDALDEDAIGSSSEALSLRDQLKGTYINHNLGMGQIYRLELLEGGEYNLARDGAGQILCIMAPCTLPESGKWVAGYGSSTGTPYLGLMREGETQRDWYRIVFAMDGGPMTLVGIRGDKTTSTLERENQQPSARQSLNCSVPDADRCQYLASGDLGYCVDQIFLEDMGNGTGRITIHPSAPTALMSPRTETVERFEFNADEIWASWDEGDSRISGKKQSDGTFLTDFALEEDFGFFAVSCTRHTSVP